MQYDEIDPVKTSEPIKALPSMEAPPIPPHIPAAAALGPTTAEWNSWCCLVNTVMTIC